VTANFLPDFIAYLGNVSAISALVGSRIYPQRLPQAVTFPAIYYSQVSAVRVYSLSGETGRARRRITLNIVAATQSSADAIAQAVRGAISGWTGGWMADTFVGSILLDNEYDFFEEDAGTVGVYRIAQDYIVAHLED
jgi:hypothetical protein